MKLVIYGDFNCPYSCLASARADGLVERGLAEVEWRAVEHDPGVPCWCSPSATCPAAWARWPGWPTSAASHDEPVPEWDGLLARDTDGVLVAKMNATLDGEFQKYRVEAGSYIRQHFFGPDERLGALVGHLSDDASPDGLGVAPRVELAEGAGLALEGTSPLTSGCRRACRGSSPPATWPPPGTRATGPGSGFKQGANALHQGTASF